MFSVASHLTESGIFIIRCENPYSGEDSLRPSHRPDGHGLGLSILEDLANRYQGEINVEHIQNVFVVTIWLNAQKE